jgi:DNA relaxase NicK
MEFIEPVALERVIDIPTDVERKLKWLEKQVKPTLRKLSELGYGDAAATAMGLWVPKET